MPTASHQRYFNRELSWLQFNHRVMEEARNKRVPLLERLRFLSISASNLDEFYMVRVAGLRTQMLAGMNAPSFDGLTPERQLDKIAKRVDDLITAQEKCWVSIRSELATRKISVLTVSDLDDQALSELQTRFDAQILPLLSPLSVDPAHPFPFLSNLSLGLVASLAHKTEADEQAFALVPIPSHLPRFLQLSAGTKKREYLQIEDVIAYFLPSLFPDFDMRNHGLFRITRDSDIAIDEEAEDLVRHFEFLLKERRRGRVIRLELNEGIETELRDFLVENFECWDEDIQEAKFLGMVDLKGLIDNGRNDLLFPPFQARFPERIRDYDGDHFAAIAAKDILVHHPYEEFDVVIQFLRQAARDPDVVVIKQTLYRTSDDSPIVRALIDAAESGKSVTALVELQARFDEASNLRFARDLERAGVQVVYGLLGFKTHAKVSLVIRREGERLQTYTHLGTGNYHALNAKIYTDLALFTADPVIGADVGKLFNFVTSSSRPRDLAKLSLAPHGLRDRLFEQIDAEIDNAKAGRPSGIWAKLNALVDKGVIDKLYEASQAGVPIELVVRGICCLRPGVKGLSETIRVKSIVGRFLEHSRVVAFGNGHALPSQNAKLFMSSADWMPRNLDRRIETLVPIESATVHDQVLDQIMVANLMDNENSWDLQPNGKYARRKASEDEEPFSAHKYFMDNPSLSGRGHALKTSRPKDLPDPPRVPVKSVDPSAGD
ncbi:RNA degradosome polyphosphate kinase [Algimonas porphyrae]|uniref:Polyphosphate kinase n=1 Tax=Algimonas porphyrae TaxID=1128113 RepID=A0ABQ5V3F4_9PROT|nr:RNA degradosome polyphosphate kinase [Algimonas porphyrae]GLQ21254.1 polyphosphate kinase [Algimonas porphyrae]